jgi:hypothetical protein
MQSGVGQGSKGGVALALAHFGFAALAESVRIKIRGLA